MQWLAPLPGDRGSSSAPLGQWPWPVWVPPCWLSGTWRPLAGAPETALQGAVHAWGRASLRVAGRLPSPLPHLLPLPTALLAPHLPLLPSLLPPLPPQLTPLLSPVHWTLRSRLAASTQPVWGGPPGGPSPQPPDKTKGVEGSEGGSPSPHSQAWCGSEGKGLPSGWPSGCTVREGAEGQPHPWTSALVPAGCERRPAGGRRHARAWWEGQGRQTVALCSGDLQAVLSQRLLDVLGWLEGFLSSQCSRVWFSPQRHIWKGVTWGFGEVGAEPSREQISAAAVLLGQPAPCSSRAGQLAGPPRGWAGGLVVPWCRHH